MIETASNISETVSETLGQVGALCRTAGKKVHDARRGTADALNGSASTVRDTAEAIDELAESTATKLDSTAAFVRNYDPGDVFVSLGRWLVVIQQSSFRGQPPPDLFSGLPPAENGLPDPRNWRARSLSFLGLSRVRHDERTLDFEIRRCSGPVKCSLPVEELSSQKY